MEGLSKKKKGLMDMDNSVVIAVGEAGVRGLNGNRKNTRKSKLKKYCCCAETKEAERNSYGSKSPLKG